MTDFGDGDTRPCQGWCKQTLRVKDMFIMGGAGLFCDECSKRVIRERHRMICTPVERDVLDAMTGLRTEWLQDMLGSDRCFPNEPDCVARVKLHEAELRRRGVT